MGKQWLTELMTAFHYRCWLMHPLTYSTLAWAGLPVRGKIAIE